MTAPYSCCCFVCTVFDDVVVLLLFTVFDDGDERTLKRSSLCLKGGRHFDKSEVSQQMTHVYIQYMIYMWYDSIQWNLSPLGQK